MLRKRGRENILSGTLSYVIRLRKIGTFGWKIDHVILGLFLASIISYLFLSSGLLVNEEAFTLIVFNFLFVFTTFPIGGKLATKVLLLFLGNLLGLLWNYLFFITVQGVGNSVLSDFLQIFSPLSNLIWIVTFYSVSLTVLSSSRRE